MSLQKKKKKITQKQQLYSTQNRREVQLLVSVR